MDAATSKPRAMAQIKSRRGIRFIFPGVQLAEDIVGVAQKSRPVSFAASPPSVRKGCAFPKAALLLQARLFASFDAEADSLD